MRGYFQFLIVALAAAAGIGPAGASAVRRTPVVEAVERALPSVVNIGTEKLVQVVRNDPFQRFRGDMFDQLFGQFFGVLPGSAVPEVRHSLGSGVIIDPTGYILTNYHVIERASAIRVTLMDNSAFTARFVAGDEVNDLALIKIDCPRPLAALRFAHDNDLMLGETVLALGNPFGLAHSVSAGVLSAKNREARSGDQVIFRDILQTDAAVNPGSSGGPLVNLDGEMIGVNVAIYQEAQNIGFAVPVQRVRALLTQWMAPRALNKLLTGLDLAETGGRVRVTAVDPAGPAAASGLQPGDTLIGVNGLAADSLLDAHRAMAPARAGDEVRLAYERGGTAKVASLRVQAVPKPSGEALARARLGLAFGDPAGGRFRQGLPVREVVAGGTSGRAGVQPGMYVVSLNGTAVNSIDDVGLALENTHTGDRVALVVVKIEERDSLLLAQTAKAEVAAD